MSKHTDGGKVNLEHLLSLPKRKRFELIARYDKTEEGAKICLIYGGSNHPPQLYYTPFAGYFLMLKDKHIPNGELIDLRGPSNIEGELTNQNILILHQRYNGKKGLITYQFDMEGDAWVGTYSSGRYGNGEAICSIQSMGDLLDSRDARCGG